MHQKVWIQKERTDSKSMQAIYCIKTCSGEHWAKRGKATPHHKSANKTFAIENKWKQNHWQCKKCKRLAIYSMWDVQKARFDAGWRCWFPADFPSLQKYVVPEIPFKNDFLLPSLASLWYLAKLTRSRFVQPFKIFTSADSFQSYSTLKLYTVFRYIL